MTWQTVRTLTTQAAESGVPSSAVFVAHPEAGQYSTASGRIPYAEIGYDSLVLAGSPTSVTLAVWRLSDAKVEKLFSTTILAADVAAPIPLDVEVDAEALWVTVESFVGGTAPTLSGVVRYRPSRSGASRPVRDAASEATLAALYAVLAQPTRTFPITPSDTTDLSSTVTKGLIVSVAGTLVYKLSGDSTASTITVFGGQYVPGVVSRVMAATTATVLGLGG